MLKKLYTDEYGFVVSAELVLVATIAVLGMVVGLVDVRDEVAAELNDIASAIGAVSQTYHVAGLQKEAGATGGHGGGGTLYHASIAGFGFNDRADTCDCALIELVDVCGKTQGGSTTAE